MLYYSLRSVSQFLTGRIVCSPNILRTDRRNIIRFLTELLLRRTWFRQFDEICFVLNWLIMRCKRRPGLAAEAQQTAWLQNVGESSQYTLIIPHRVIQLTTISFWFLETRLRLPQVNKQVNSLRSEWSIDTVIHFYFYFFLIHRRTLCSPPIRGNIRRTGRIFPEHAERSFLDPEYSFIAVRRILQTIFTNKKFTQLRTNYIHQILPTMFMNKCSPS